MGKPIMFMIWVWLFVSLAGGIMQGSTSTATTVLTANVSLAEANAITVNSTTGFPRTGTVVIGGEQIAYAEKTATTFRRTSFGGVTISPMVRGANGTIVATHVIGNGVRTVESSMLNASLGYKMAMITDASGLMVFVTIPFAFVSLIITFFTLPLAFLGTDFVILTYLWAVISIGIIVALAVTLAGGRRV